MTPTLAQLIEKGKFDYVNSSITEDLFPAPKTLHTDYKLFHFNKFISSQEAIVAIKKEGYIPATLHELLMWEEWNDKDTVVALGSSAHVDGHRGVPGLYGFGAERGLHLGWWRFDWHGDCRFLAVRNLPLDTQTISSPDSLALCISYL